MKRSKKTWDMRKHNGWGDSIQWCGYAENRLMGWTDPHPEVGDEVLSNMKSGRVGIYRIIKVEPQRNPPDMWFADTEGVGYLEEQRPVEHQAKSL